MISSTRLIHKITLVCLQARPLFKDRKKFHLMADPALDGQYPKRGLYQALAIAAMCIQEKPKMRPLISEVVTAMDYLASRTYDPDDSPTQEQRRKRSTHQLKKDAQISGTKSEY